MTRPSPIHGPYSLHITFTPGAGSGGYLPTASPLRLQDGRVLTAGFYHRHRRAINYANLHMASGYLLLRHYQQPVKPNLQGHPYTTIGAAGRPLHGPRLDYLLPVFLRHYREAMEPLT